MFGRRARFTAMFMNAWPAINVVIPVARSFANVSFAFWAISNPRMAMNR